MVLTHLIPEDRVRLTEEEIKFLVSYHGGQIVNGVHLHLKTDDIIRHAASALHWAKVLERFPKDGK